MHFFFYLKPLCHSNHAPSAVITPYNTVGSFVAAVTAHSIALPMIQSKYQDLANRSSAPNPRIWILDHPDDEDSKLLQTW
jgi:hypothetical protein